MESWLESHGHDRGEVVSAQTMYDLSRDWYATRMNEDWDPPDPEAITATFYRHGLTGDFWSVT